MSEAVNDARTFARNAKGVRELLSMKFDTLPFEGEWYDAFGTPESRGVWIVWGKSGSGKTSFVMKLCKELCKYGRVVYNSLEEGIGRKFFDVSAATEQDVYAICRANGLTEPTEIKRVLREAQQGEYDLRRVKRVVHACKRILEARRMKGGTEQ